MSTCFADGDVGVDVPVFAQDALDGALVQVQVGAGIDRQAVLGLPADGDPRRLSVDADLVFVEFFAQARVLLDLEDGEDEDDEVGRADDREHGLAVTAAARGALDEPRHVEHLNVGAAVLQHAGIDVEVS